ncbi:MAG TPA: rhodanese-like domain-containing protein [Pyrinomonadaceae bacterium]|nr:rhodanese-like domain-containing protein [Pyrinomonadaceae bacterium]
MEPTRVTVDEVKERMDRGEQLIFVDTRNPKAWSEAQTALPNALRMLPDDVAQKVDDLPKDRSIITYCT